jgi:hypothetical protein
MANIWNSSSFQPTTMLRPKRPRPTRSAVTICFAAMTGLSSGTWTVANTVMRRVRASSPQAQVMHSRVVP